MLWRNTYHRKIVRDRTRLRKGFTLVELLVSIAIIAVLASLIVPSLGAAKAKAHSARCLSNLRQIGIALRVYAGDNEGALPRAVSFGSTLQAAATVDKVLRSHVSENTNVFRCPSAPRLVQDSETSYEWNSTLNGRLLHRVEDPAITFLVRDRLPWHHKNKKNTVFVDGHTATSKL